MKKVSAKRGYRYMRNYGVAGLYIKVKEHLERNNLEKDYQAWIESVRPGLEEKKLQRGRHFPYEPLISIVVPVYRTPEKFLREMLESVLSQTYGKLELCLADGSGEDDSAKQVILEYAKRDSRVHYQKLSKNLGISGNTNAAVQMASGDYVGLLDHDDLLEEHALFEVVKWLAEHPDTDLLYTDEDKVTFDSKTCFRPHFKPDFNLDLLRSNNYICHFLVVRRSLACQAGLYREEFDGAQDYDFILRCCEQAKEIGHIPKILYHWRSHMDSTAENPESKAYAYEAGRRAVEMHLQRTRTIAQVEQMENPGFYRVNYSLLSKPKVSVVLLDVPGARTLQRFMKVLKKGQTYRNYEVFALMEAPKKTKIILKFIKEHRQTPIKVVYCTSACNKFVTFSRLAEKLDSDYLLFLDSRLEKISDRFMEIFLGNALRPEAGAVGGRVYDNDRRLRHGAKILGLMGAAGDAFAGLHAGYTGYFHKAVLQQNFHAVSVQAMMVSREHFLAAGGFSEDVEDHFKDVDLCLKLEGMGLKNIYDPGIAVVEQKSRGRRKHPERAASFERKWRELLNRPDSCYNCNLSLEDADFRIRKARQKENDACQTLQL